MDDTSKLLQQLQQLDYPAYQTVVVDNGSTDSSTTQLKTRFPEITVFDLPTNTGFGRANNVAINQAMNAGFPFVWLLNNDAWPEKEALRKLVEHMQADLTIGALGTTVFDDDGSHELQSYGGGHIYPWLGYVRHNKTASEPLEFLTASSLLLRTEALRDIGLFDERFFLYWEDADLSFRLRSAGWKLGVTETTVYHRGSSTSGRWPRMKAHHIQRSYRLFAQKHYRLAEPKSFCSAAFQSLCKLAKARPREAWGCWTGWMAGRRAIKSA